MSTTTSSPWTDEDVEQVSAAIHRQLCTSTCHGDPTRDDEFAADLVLMVLAPRVAELQRAAKVEALRDAAALSSTWRTHGWLRRRADEIERGDR